MKFLPLIWAGLWRKPARTVLTSIALVVAFTLFGLLQSINAGIDALVESARDDGLRVFARFGAPMPLAYKQQLGQLPGVKSVTAVTNMGGAINGDPKRGLGINFADGGFLDFYRWLDTTPAQQAAWREQRNGIVVGKMSAEAAGLKAGDRIVIKSMPKLSGGNDWELDVLAIVDRKDIPNAATVAVGNFEYVNEDRVQGKDTVSLFLVLMDDPALAVATAKKIDQMFFNSGAPTRTEVHRVENEQQWQEDNNLDDMANGVVLATLFALLLMTGNSMMQAFRERVPEFGTLKAIGFSDRQVLGFVFFEALVQCLAGAIVGLAIAKLTLPYVRTLYFAQLRWSVVPWSLIALGILVAVLVAFISAAVPAWRAGRMQIVNALAAR